MIERNIYKELITDLSAKQALVITGMRRVGKTTAAKFLLNRIRSDNKLYLDLERAETRNIFNEKNYGNIIRALELEGLNMKIKSFIVLDEIQLVQNIPSVVKYLYDTFDIKFILTGSSSFYMSNRFSESMAGRKIIFELFPLAFDEYLLFKEAGVKLPPGSFDTIQPSFYNKLKVFYDEFVQFGGFPEVALASRVRDKKNILKDIVNSYLKMDIKFLADFNVADELYNLVRLLTSRVGSRTDFSKIGSIAGIDRRKLKEYILFLEQTYLIHQVPAFVRSADREISLQKKLYFSDTGILNMMGQVSSGALFENAVALQLLKKGKINYYSKKTGQEIDFILDGHTAFEVKESPTQSDVLTLRSRAESIGLKKYYLVGMNYSNRQFNGFVWAGSIY